MKVTNPKAPVRLEWLAGQGYRLDASTYVSGTYEIRDLLKRLTVSTEPLHDLTAGHDGGLYNGPQFRRIYVTDRDHGVPFVGSADMLEADLTNLPLLRRKNAESSKLSFLRLEPGMSLISCSGTVGKVSYVRPDMANFWSSQDSIKVVANPEKIRFGYLQAFLRSRYGVPFLTTAKYGTGIRHLEPSNIADMLVPRFDDRIEQQIHDLVEEAARSRADFQARLVAATRDLFLSAGLSDLVDLNWHKQARDLGYWINNIDASTLRSLNFVPRARAIVEKLRAVPHRTLGDICEDGVLKTGARFKRIDADPAHGVRLVGQRQAFWIRPSGRWISAAHAPGDIIVPDETVLIAAHGTLGENEVYGRSILVTGSWLGNAYSQDFVRVVSGDLDYPGPYLFAFLRSEAAFRVLRSMSVGGKQQEYHTALIRKLPVPECDAEVRQRITEEVRTAYRARDAADEAEDQALALLDSAVEEAAG